MKTILKSYFKERETTELLDELSENVSQEPDIVNANESIGQLLRILKKFGYISEEKNPKRSIALLKGSDPFELTRSSFERDRIEVFNYCIEELDTNEIMEYLSKLCNRALFNTIEYRIGRNFLRKTQTDPNRIIEQHGFDKSNLITDLTNEFEIFIESIKFYGGKLEELTNKISSNNILKELDPSVIIPLSTNYVYSIIGGVSSKEADQFGNVTNVKTIGFYGVINDSWNYNSFSEKIPELLEIKKGLLYCDNKFKEALYESKSTLLEKADELGEEYEIMVDDSLEKILRDYKREIKKEDKKQLDGYV